MALDAGDRLGRYEIREPLGAGGMGEVYRARDERLDRDVAIKVLPEAVAREAGRLARFEREARAVAALSHPNLVDIHDVGSDGGVHYAVMELLEGDTLRQRIPASGLPWQRAAELGAAVADGLAAAHSKGIVHRDVKPENLLMTLDGRIKILDFGLARVQEAVSSEGETGSLISGGTEAGTVMGTPGYMAPEQVRGEPADARSDIFALGCVLYEMVAGGRAFGGESGMEVMAAILKEEPPQLSSTGATVPVDLERAVRRCLEKRPEARFQSAADLAFALRMVFGGASGVGRAVMGPGGDRPSIAVLPFTNLSADPEQEYFCDGVAEEIINALAHLDGLRVIARTSSFAFRGRNEDIRDIGGRLDVGTALEGSVRKAGDRVRITAQLIDVRDGSHLWSERFDRRLEDIFAIQEEIALAIVDSLEVRLLGRERVALERRSTGDLEAHTAYLRGRYEWNRMTPESFVRSRELLERAIRVDPGFVAAHVTLAVWFLSQAFWGHMESGEAQAHALPLVDRALALDPGAAEAYTVRANFLGFGERRWADAEAWLGKAIQLGPSLAEGHLYLGGQLLVRGRLDEAAVANRRALRLDPVSPTTGAWAASWLAHCGAREEGVGELSRLIAVHPEHWLLRWAMASAVAKERPDEALAEAERAAALSGGAAVAVSFVACLRHVTGDASGGDEMLRRLAELQEEIYVSPTVLAWAQLARGDKAAAMNLLGRARAINDPMLAFTRLGSGGLYPRDAEVEAFMDGLLNDH